MTKRRPGELPRAAVVGAGRMGHGIALELARGGYLVSIYDVQRGRARQAITEAEQDATDLIAAGVIEAADVENIVSRLEAVPSIPAAVDGVDVVFEAVAEDLDIKREVFAQLDQYARVDTLLLSNTSSIGITEIAVSCRYPERVALAHWILPPHLIPVVEVAPGEQTAESTIVAARKLLESLGKWPIVLRCELPGYLINRLQFALLREAMELVGQGVASATEIDRAVRGSIARRMPVLGLFGQADTAGLDVYQQIFRYLAPDLNRGTASPAVLDEAIQSGRTGATSGHGFYPWSPDDVSSTLHRRNAELIRLLRVDRFG